MGKKSTTIHPYSLKRSASQERRVRTSSPDRTGGSLKHQGRKRAREDDEDLSSTDMKDFSAIGVYSREAFENFGKTWRSLKDSAPIEHTTKVSRKGVSDDVAADRLGRLHRSSVSTGFKDQVQSLFKDRSIPHVIVVIEGKKEESTLTLGANVDSKIIDLDYTLVSFFQGETSLGAKDDKQSMSLYVRNDMRTAYSFTKEKISRGSDIIPAVGINYQTQDGTKYRSLAVHIPNEFVGSDKEVTITHKAFEDYAQSASAHPNPVIVTSYFGDTNYKKPIFKDSVPSMGGHLPNGGTLNPRSSAAIKDTNFMQSIPVGPSRSEHSVLQPATLNYVYPTTDAANRSTTDHPSIIQITAHKSPIIGRDPSVFPDYYAPKI